MAQVRKLQVETTDRTEALSKVRGAVKRIGDLLVAVPGMLLLLPFFGLIALWIKRDSPGPVFYRGPRMGKGGKEFKILKFRTMYERPESYQGPRVTAEGDPRITRAGYWLRETKLNELPQVINVIRGEMSLVGPRPEDPEIVAKWPRRIQEEVLSVRPGITSPASVQFRHEESMLAGGQVMDRYIKEVLPSKLRLDQLYVRNHSILLDVDTLFWTFMVLILRLKTYTPPEDLLFIGPVYRLVHRHLNWFVVDILITLGAIGTAGILFRSFGPLDVGWPAALVAGFAFALIFSLTGSAFGIHRITWSRASSADALDLIFPVLSAMGLGLLANYLWGILRTSPNFPPDMILLASGLAFLGYVGVRYRWQIVDGLVARLGRLSRRAQAVRERVLIIGGGTAGQIMAWMLAHQEDPGAFKIVGYVDDDLYKQGQRIQGVEVLGRCPDIPRLVVEHDVGILILAIHRISPLAQQRIRNLCARTSAHLVVVPDIIGALNALVQKNSALEPGSEEEGQLHAQTFTWSGIPPRLVDAWLEGLLQKAADEDLESLRSQIVTLRHWIRSTDGLPDVAWGSAPSPQASTD